MANDGVQHGIDDNPHGDAEKGAVGGAVGGAIVGALAGGPVGAVIGAVAGGVASGVGVAAVDQVDNDNTVSGVGDGATRSGQVGTSGMAGDAGVGGHNIVTGGPAVTDDGKTGLGAGAIAGGVVGAAVGGPVGAVVGGALGSVAGGVAGDATEAASTEGTAGGGYSNTSTIGTVGHTSQPVGTSVSNTAHSVVNDVNADLPGNKVPGVQTGGYTTAGQDTRGIVEKTADIVTGDRTDDNTGGRVVNTSHSTTVTSVGSATQNVVNDVNADLPGNKVPGVQTGGVTTSGQDTRGITEKAADALTGDRTDDKTGGRVL